MSTAPGTNAPVSANPLPRNPAMGRPPVFEDVDDVRTATASVPGKVMLAGEYAVLLGGRALAMTIGRNLTVTATVGASPHGCIIASEFWGAARAYQRLDEADPRVRAEPLLGAVAFALHAYGIDRGVEVKVTSELDVRAGLGSSSALRIGTLMALAAASGQDLHPWAIGRDAFDLQRRAQGRASGYDFATQLAGGVISFQRDGGTATWPGRAERLGRPAEGAVPQVLRVVAGGRGAPTAKTMGGTFEYLESRGLLADLLPRSEALVDAFVQALGEGAPTKALIAAVPPMRALFEESPAYPAATAQALKNLPGCDRSWTFKTTGAGGEDALLLIGGPDELTAPLQALAARGWKDADPALSRPAMRGAVVQS